MLNVSDSMQAQSQQISSPLDEMLKSKGVLPTAEPSSEEQKNTSTSMTIANFSPQSIVMSNAQSAQGGLLQSVMASAANSGAETSTERTMFGKQAANNLMQTMEKDAFDDTYSNLFDNLKTDLENRVEESLATESTETPIAEEHVASKPIVNDDGTPVTTTSTETASAGASQAASTSTTTPTTTEAAPVEAQAEAPAESSKSAAPPHESVDVYV